MEWIRNNKKYLIAVLAISVILIFAILYPLRNTNGTQSIATWQLGVMAVPWVLFGASFFPLMYLSWFGENKKSITINLLKLFYWVLLSGFVAIFVGIYAIFVFNF